MPSRIHQADRSVRPPGPVEAKGGPLSERIASGQAVLAKRRFEHVAHLGRARLEHDLAAQHQAAECVGEGQRVDRRAVECAEVSLEVDAPELVRCGDVGEWPNSRHNCAIDFSPF
jgi:hypothetical protein